jgi:hypothetical protein
LARQYGNRSQQADALKGLGAVSQRLGQHHHAVDYHHQALALFTAIGDPSAKPRPSTAPGRPCLP